MQSKSLLLDRSPQASGHSSTCFPPFLQSLQQALEIGAGPEVSELGIALENCDLVW